MHTSAKLIMETHLTILSTKAKNVRVIKHSLLDKINEVHKPNCVYQVSNVLGTNDTVEREDTFYSYPEVFL